jgi:hypothetical protein
MVIEFDRDEKCIVVSHTRIWVADKIDEVEAFKKRSEV